MNKINEGVLKNRELSELICNKEYGNAIDKTIELTLLEVIYLIEKSQSNVAMQTSEQSVGWHNALEQLKLDLGDAKGGNRK